MTNNDERSLRAYLLGVSAPDEQRRIEERLLADGDYVELLQIVEEELMDAYLANRLASDEREAFEGYFLSTPQRRRKLRMAEKLKTYIAANKPAEQTGLASAPPSFLLRFRDFLTRGWRPAVAALCLLLGGHVVWRVFFYVSYVERGRASTQAAFIESPREGKVAGFNWPPPKLERGQAKDLKEIIRDERELISADADLNAAFRDEPGPESAHALGQLYLVKGEFDDAIAKLEFALEGDSKNAAIHNDLGMALMERSKRAREQQTDAPGKAQSGRRVEDLARSLEHLTRALELQENLEEALFNRALCREHLQMLSLAKEDWQAYLRIDPDSAWAHKAKEHLDELERRIPLGGAGALQGFLDAYAAGDRQAAWEIVRRNREPFPPQLLWWRLIDDLLKQAAAGDSEAANERLKALKLIGDLELSRGKVDGTRTGDPFVLKLANFYGTLSSRQRATLLQAHSLVSEGNSLLDSDPVGARDRYERASVIFAQSGNVWQADLLRFLIGYLYLWSLDEPRSLAVLKPLAETCKEENYSWLLAQVYNALGSANDQMARLSDAVEYTKQALEISDHLDDRDRSQKNLAQLAGNYLKLGDFDNSLACLSELMERMTEALPGPRQMWRSYGALVQVMNARRFYVAAEGYSHESLPFVRGPLDDYVTRFRLALVLSKQRRHSEAIRQAEMGLEIAKARPDKVTIAYAPIQLGDVYRQAGEFDKALAWYQQAIATFESEKTPPVWQYAAYKGRLFCYLDQGNDAAAREQLEATLSVAEKYRGSIREEKNRNTFFDVEQDVYDAAIRFSYFRLRDKKRAFDYSEQSRARSLLDLLHSNSEAGLPPAGALTLEQVQEQLPHETQVLKYDVLQDKVLIWVISKTDVEVKEATISLGEITRKSLDFHRSIARNHAGFAEANDLHRLLIQPVEGILRKDRQVCVVPDKTLNFVPFNALVSPAGKRTIEEYTFSFAPSATVYVNRYQQARARHLHAEERLLSVGNPSFDTAMFPLLPRLPEAEAEAMEIAAYYSEAMPLVGKDAREDRVLAEMRVSDVVHLASHYEVNEWSPMNSALLLAREPGEPGASLGVLEPREIAALKLPRTRLVVLSACKSGVERYYSGEGLIGMSRVFIAAGVPLVVGSLWNVEAGAATKRLMVKFHENRKRGGLSTVDALRKAQLDMMASRDYNHPYYWAPFIAIGGHTDF
jgi:CHAT domain-containing protein